jgi:hypothetical protein
MRTDKAEIGAEGDTIEERERPDGRTKMLGAGPDIREPVFMA